MSNSENSLSSASAKQENGKIPCNWCPLLKLGTSRKPFHKNNTSHGQSNPIKIDAVYLATDLCLSWPKVLKKLPD